MPDPRQFTLSIALGNGAVTSVDDIAAALIAVASEVEAQGGLRFMVAPILDVNGHAVGHWSIG